VIVKITTLVVVFWATVPDIPTLVLCPNACFFLIWHPMKTSIFLISFVVSVGMAAFGIMAAYRLKDQEKKGFAPSLFYYEFFLAAFGFYSIWSHLGIGYLLDDVIASKNTLLNILSIFPLLGVPLMILAWHLFIRFCVELVGKKLPIAASVVYFSAFALVLLFLGNYFRYQVVNEKTTNLLLISKGLAVWNVIVLATGTSIILFQKKKLGIDVPKYSLAGLFLIPAILSSTALFMVPSHWLFVVLFVLFYFSQIAMAPAFIYFKRPKLEKESPPGFEKFCRSFGISRREAEIVREICIGKSNQEIAEALFITVQTVKDHAHRIYTKTEVKNRVQLTNLVREKIKPGPTLGKS
jgi:DNA-binding CsgD family transcriptional regulator